MEFENTSELGQRGSTNLESRRTLARSPLDGMVAHAANAHRVRTAHFWPSLILKLLFHTAS